MKTLASALAASVLVVSSAQAVTVYSWENNAQGFSAISGYSTTTGVTDGTYAAIHDAPTGFSWGLQTGDWAGDFANLNAAQQTGTMAYVDVTTTAEAVPDGATLSIGLWVWHNGGNASLGSFGVTPDGQTQTLVFDFSSVGGSPSWTWSQLRIWTNASNDYNPSALYFDNFRIGPIPEPASLGLLGLGGLAMLRRRRA